MFAQLLQQSCDYIIDHATNNKQKRKPATDGNYYRRYRDSSYPTATAPEPDAENKDTPRTLRISFFVYNESTELTFSSSCMPPIPPLLDVSRALQHHQSSSNSSGTNRISLLSHNACGTASCHKHSSSCKDLQTSQPASKFNTNYHNFSNTTPTDRRYQNQLPLRLTT